MKLQILCDVKIHVAAHFPYGFKAIFLAARRLVSSSESLSPVLYPFAEERETANPTPPHTVSPCLQTRVTRPLPGPPSKISFKPAIAGPPVVSGELDGINSASLPRMQTAI
jgi:hypothetical protein